MPSVGVYLSDSLRARLQRLKDRGVDLNTSAISQRALESTVEASEAALDGDRLRRMVHRLKAARSASEQAEADGAAAGRAWAEDVAALSELKEVAKVEERFPYFYVRGINLEPVVELWGYDGREDDPDAAEPERLELPESVPRALFERALEEPRYRDSFISGFLGGATGMLTLALEAMGRETDVDPDDIAF